MSQQNDAAFPTVLNIDTIMRGLSKRELFAAMALQGILAHPKSSATPEFLATVAVETADALLAALSEEKK